MEFEAKDGWGLLCAFLGREVPEGEYPRINDREGWWRGSKKREMWKRIGIWGGVVVGVVGFVAGVVFWGSSAES